MKMGIGIGWPNATSGGGGPVPTEERYLVQDCVTGDQLDTQLYAIGDFEINDRVTYDINGNPTYGKVIGITENEDYDCPITATGVNSSQCYDNYVVLYSGNELGDNSVSFGIVLESIDADFISNNNEYAMSISYNNSVTVLIYVTSEEGDPPYYDEIQTGWSDTIGFGTYQYEQNQTYDLVYQQENFGPNESTVEFYDQEIFISVSFENINGYTSNDGCPNYSFLRNSGSQAGSTFNMSYRNDDC